MSKIGGIQWWNHSRDLQSLCCCLSKTCFLCFILFPLISFVDVPSFVSDLKWSQGICRRGQGRCSLGIFWPQVFGYTWAVFDKHVFLMIAGGYTTQHVVLYKILYIYVYILYIYIMYIWYIESMFYLAPLSFFLVGSLTGAKSHIFSVFSGYGLAGTFPDRIK